MEHHSHIVRVSSHGQHVAVSIVLTITLIAIVMLCDFTQTWSSYLLIVLAPVIIFLMVYLFPPQYLKLTKESDTVFDLQMFIFKKVSWRRKVSLVAHWWNYTDLNLKGIDQGRYAVDANYPKNIGTGNMNSSGVPTEITLYLKLVDTEGEYLLLYEEKGNWASIPPWKYDLEKAKDNKECIRCKGLKKLIGKLGLEVVNN